jgi:hypothetical protein
MNDRESGASSAVFPHEAINTTSRMAAGMLTRITLIIGIVVFPSRSRRDAGHRLSKPYARALLLQ